MNKFLDYQTLVSIILNLILITLSFFSTLIIFSIIIYTFTLTSTNMEKGLDSIEQSKNLISNPTKLETKSKNTVQELQEYMEKCVFKNPMPPECLVQNIRFNIMQSNPELAKKEVSFDAGKIKKTSFIDALLEKNFISVFSDRFIINVIYIFLFIGQWLMLFLLFS